MSAPESKFLEVNGLRLHHLDWGNAGATPLVFVHGLGSNAHAFDAPASLFSDRFHVIAVDVRGRGDSDWSPAGSYEHTDYLSDLEGVVDQLGFEGFVLAGTSMGGIISMNYAGAHRERLLGLIINDVGPDREPRSQRERPNPASAPSSFASLGEAIAYRVSANAAFGNLDRAAQERQLGYMVRQRDDGHFYWKNDPEFQRQVAERGGTAEAGHLWPVLHQFTAPALVLWGSISEVLSEGQARRMVETLPQGELVTVPGVGHAPSLSEPAAVEGLERFLTRLLPVGAGRASV